MATIINYTRGYTNPSINGHNKAETEVIGYFRPELQQEPFIDGSGNMVEFHPDVIDGNYSNLNAVFSKETTNSITDITVFNTAQPKNKVLYNKINQKYGFHSSFSTF